MPLIETVMKEAPRFSGGASSEHVSGFRRLAAEEGRSRPQAVPMPA